MAHAPLLVHEREEIARALTLNPDSPWAVIARIICRHPRTVACEVERNGGRRRYTATAAQARAEACRRRPRPAKLMAPGSLRTRVTSELGQGRSPAAIAADLTAEGGPSVCHETIYQAIYHGHLAVKARDCLRTRRPRRRCRQQRHPSSRPTLPSITDRPATVNDRHEAGHWEADLIIGARNRSAMLTMCERVSRFTIPVVLHAGYTADETLAGLCEAFEQIPVHLRRSVTFDQGSEWALWETLTTTYKMDAWFCEPHSPWQRGQIENVNRQLRWWFPRGTDLGAVDPAYAHTIAELLNNQRRRSLNNQTPTAVYAALNAR